MKLGSIFIIAFSSFCLQASAQQTQSPSSPEFNFCANRPDEPALLKNMGTKEAHRALLLQRMYLALSFDTIVLSEDCSCANRYPDWQPVVEYYLENYARLEDRHDIYDATDPYDESIRANRLGARELCVAQDHWN